MTIVIVLESADSDIVDLRAVEQATIAETTNLGVVVSKRFYYLQLYGMLWINSTNSNYGLDLNLSQGNLTAFLIRSQEKQSCELKEIAL